ncbi:hypothetical protein JCM3774_000950 [Rhodotorula dairenensis]
MDATDVSWTEPIASTSRAVFTLPCKPTPDDGSDDLAASRGVEAYRAAWNACHHRIQDTLSTLHDASLDQIVAFVRASDSVDAQLYAALASRVLLRTGLIIGASPGSASLLYSSLVRQLSGAGSDNPEASSQPCLVSRLTSRDCSNIKNALRTLIGGFIGSDIDVELDDDDDEEEEILSTGPATRKSEMLVPEDMLNLQAWYQHRFAKHDAHTAPKLVVLIEDLEAMDGKVFTQMIDTLSAYTDKLPLTLLVGIATTADALWTLLARKTANKLDAASFFVDPGVGAFNALMRGLFIDWQAPLALSPKVYDYLWRTFDDLHHSIDATISFIQHVYMSHYISSPAHSLRPTSVHEDAAEALQDLQSLGCYKEISVDGRPVEAVLQTAREGYAAWHAARKAAFHVLLRSMEFWDKRKPLESTLSAVLGDGDGGRGILRTVDELCNLVLQASSAKLPNYLRAVLSRLETVASGGGAEKANNENDDDSSFHSDGVRSFLAAQLSALEPVLAAPRPAGRSTLFNTNLAGAFSIPGMGNASKVDHDFSKVAKETADGLKQRLRHAFRPHTAIALHELWFSEDRSAVKRFFPAPLPATLRLLRKEDPFAAHDDGAGAGDSEDEPRAQLDLAVAYRTYADTHPQGRLANLGEWWGAFELAAADEVQEKKGDETGQENGGGEEGGKKGLNKKRPRRVAVDPEESGGSQGEEVASSSDDDDSDDAEEDEGPERRKQARFLRAVGDLAHLGFIHPTTYKAEHVLKSVY